MTDHPLVPTRRLLLVAGIAGLTGCAASTPKVANKPPPSRLLLAPVPPYDKVHVYLPTATSVGMVGKTPFVVQSTQGSESAMAKRITALLAQQK